MSVPAYKKALRSLLPSIQGGVAARYMIVLCPLDDVLRAIAFEPSAFSKAAFYVNATVLPLYIPRDHMSYQFGDRLGNSWDFDDKSYIATLHRLIQSKGMRILSRGQSVRDFVRYLEQDANRGDPYVIEAAAFSYALLEQYAAAIRAIEQLRGMLNLTVEWHADMADRVSRLQTAIDSGDSAVQSLLQSHRSETLQNLDLINICS